MRSRLGWFKLGGLLLLSPVLLLGYQNCGRMVPVSPSSVDSSSVIAPGADTSSEPILVPDDSSISNVTSSWKNLNFAPQSNLFSLEFDAVPHAAPMDAVIGFSSSVLTSYVDSQMMIRFSPSGLIEVRNGDAYTADAQFPYAESDELHFRVVANVAARTYSVFASTNSQSQKLIAKDYTFRTGTPTGPIQNLGAIAATGSHSVRKIKIVEVTPATPTPAPTPVATPVPTPVPISGTVSFFTDWSANSATGGWRSRQTVASDRIRVDGQTWHSKAAARVEVRPDDDPINSSGERSEVLLMPTAENSNSGTQYYGLSYKFPSNWQSTASSNPAVDWSIIFQLHGPDSLGTSPSFALNALQNGFSVSLYGGDLSSAREVESPMTGEMPQDKWIDFVIMIDYKASLQGRVTIWRRVEGETSFTMVFDKANVATLQYRGSVGDHYWKQGLYRGQNKGITNVLWMGPLARATSFEAAEFKAFGTQAGRP